MPVTREKLAQCDWQASRVTFQEISDLLTTYLFNCVVVKNLQRF